MIAKPTNVKALENYSVFVEFSDGVKGRVDLSHLAHRGIFRAWDEGNVFEHVRINEDNAIAWDENIDICPDSIYLKIKGLSFEEWQEQNRSEYATNQ